MAYPMRSMWIAALVCALGGTAAADDLQISAAAPTQGLPAVSQDGSWFARPVRAQTAACQAGQTFVEVGAISPRGDGKSELLIVHDGCDGKATAKLVEKNLASVNKTLREGKFRPVGKATTRPLPAELEIDGRKVSVSAGSGANLTVATGKTDRWTVTLEGAPLEVRGWYGGKVGGKPYVAIAVAAKGKDTGARGRERWLELWPLESGGKIAAGSPVEVAQRWLDAMRTKDVKALGELIEPPFWKVGLTPVGDRACKRKHKVTRPKQTAAVAECVANATSQLYLRFSGAEHLAEIELAELPDELERHRKKVAAMVKKGAKLVRYHVNDDGFYVFLILVTDPDTDHQMVNAALEYIEVEPTAQD